MNSPYSALLVVPWIATGVVAVVLVLYRRGHREGSWLLIGAVLGPLILPIALERASKHSRQLERGTVPAVDEPGSSRRPCVLIGVDGSPEAEEAVRVASWLAAPVAGRLVLVTVVSPDAVDGDSDGERARARDLLDRHRGQLPQERATVETQIVAGQPAGALLELAEEEAVDLIVVGRRGRGVSRAVLGSAASKLTTSAPCPVLLAAPPDVGP